MSDLYSTIVLYPAKYYPDLDKKLIRIARRAASASGMYFSSAIRDMVWDCKTRRSAENLRKRFIKASLGKDVKIEVEMVD